MRRTKKIFRFLLFPFSVLYGIVVYIRNRLYDYSIFSSKSFRLPIISVGNITVGGTGKTPHIEYLIELLKDEFSVATLSRGYKRKSKGFQYVTTDSSSRMVGDEPLQVKAKYPDVTVAVDANRVRGIKKFQKTLENLDVVMLDDAYQHRKVNANFSILLINYNRPIYKDFMLPTGNLREQALEKKRANVIIVTKAPHDLQPIQRRLMLSKIKPFPYQKVFFTTLEYGKPQPVFDLSDVVNNNGDELWDDQLSVLSVTGIAEPKLFEKYISEYISKNIYSINFADHRIFSSHDIEKIKKRFDSIDSDKKVIFTTEKDAVRLRENRHLDYELKAKLYYIPIKVKFLNNRTDDFNKQIIEYVRKNKKHSFLYPQKD
ncbi:MAG: tetraacyldisaccharide 4'-kinase [Bacteroidota bacterium]